MVNSLDVNRPALNGTEEVLLTQADYEKLKGGFLNRRDLLIAKSLRATGLRLSEVLAWRRQDFEPEGPNLYVWIARGKKRGKAQAERVAIKRELALDLMDWTKAHDLKHAEPIFFGRYRGKPVTRVQVWSAFKEAGLRTLDRPVHPHQLRDLFIKAAIDAGQPVPKVSKMVGHVSERTTLQHYYGLTLAERTEFAESVPV